MSATSGSAADAAGAARREPARAAGSAAATASSSRIVAIDLARWLAIVGMMSAHLLSSVAGSWTGATGAQAQAADVVLAGANGNASSLFAVLAGVSLVLATRSMLARGARGAALRSVLGRAIVVGAVGVVLASTAPPVYVVLNFLAFAMVVAAPLLLLPSWAVGAVAVALCVQDNDLAGVMSFAVSQTVRRQGIGSEILASALRWARVSGARSAWLQVEADNEPAIALYRQFGFRKVYEYRYWRKG